MAQLYGKALANQIPDGTNGNQARMAIGAMTNVLAEAYAKLAEYDGTGFASWSGLDAGSVQAARQYLDGANDALQKYFPQMPVSDDKLSAELVTKLRVAVSVSSTAAQYIDENFSTSFLAEMADAVIEACANVAGKVANAVSKVAGSFVGGTWWIWALLAVGLVFATKYKRATAGKAA